MKKFSINFSQKTVDFYFNAYFDYIQTLYPIEKIFILTDENIYKKNKHTFINYTVIQIKAGEVYKNMQTTEKIIQSLIENNAQRDSILIGVGGGVITDMAGFVASTFVRGIEFGFVPTSLLAMVDASVGGKNGVDVGYYKNMVGVIKQPAFILYDFNFLKTLPTKEWINGFAEIIKHSCINDKKMFNYLQNHNVNYFKNNIKETAKLIKANVKIKVNIVKNDEFENGDRKLLNFGHTIGHAIENAYKLSHGNAVSIGMIEAAKISNHFFAFKDVAPIKNILKQYGLKTNLKYSIQEIISMIKHDKKMQGNEIQFILLKSIGKAVVQKINLDEVAVYLKDIN